MFHSNNIFSFFTFTDGRSNSDCLGLDSFVALYSFHSLLFSVDYSQELFHFQENYVVSFRESDIELPVVIESRRRKNARIQAEKSETYKHIKFKSYNYYVSFHFIPMPQVSFSLFNHNFYSFSIQTLFLSTFKVHLAPFSLPLVI